jgi:hypothetical protein
VGTLAQLQDAERRCAERAHDLWAKLAWQAEAEQAAEEVAQAAEAAKKTAHNQQKKQKQKQRKAEAKAAESGAGSGHVDSQPLAPPEEPGTHGASAPPLPGAQEDDGAQPRVKRQRVEPTEVALMATVAAGSSNEAQAAEVTCSPRASSTQPGRARPQSSGAASLMPRALKTGRGQRSKAGARGRGAAEPGDRRGTCGSQHGDEARHLLPSGSTPTQASQGAPAQGRAGMSNEQLRSLMMGTDRAGGNSQ